MVAAIVGTRTLAVLICGFGWLVHAIPWTIIGLVWVYMVIWTIVLDLVKLALYSRLWLGLPGRVGTSGFSASVMRHRVLPGPPGLQHGTCRKHTIPAR
jgi:H+-transporting ATPase